MTTAQTEYRPLLCGTRVTKRLGPNDYRVVCATCGEGGSVRHSTHDAAARAAVRDSNKLFCHCRR